MSNLAKINSELGNFEIAKDHYLEIIKHYPDNIGAWYELIKIDKSYLNQDLVNKIENNYSNEKNKLIKFIQIIFWLNTQIVKILKKNLNI